MNTTMTLEQLPPKGVKREQAILALGKEEANGELFLQLVNTEKGKCKTAAQKALAQLEYAPAAPLWAKLVKGKWMGSHIMSDACSDCVSEQIAPVILKTLSLLLDEADTKPLEEGQVEQMQKFLVFTDCKGKTSLETMLKRWYTALEKEYRNQITGG